jgi:hypothetical protein
MWESRSFPFFSPLEIPLSPLQFSSLFFFLNLISNLPHFPLLTPKIPHDIPSLTSKILIGMLLISLSLVLLTHESDFDPPSTISWTPLITSSSEPNNPFHLDKGMISLIVVATLCILVGLVLGIICCCKRVKIEQNVHPNAPGYRSIDSTLASLEIESGSIAEIPGKQ